MKDWATRLLQGSKYRNDAYIFGAWSISIRLTLANWSPRAPYSFHKAPMLSALDLMGVVGELHWRVKAARVKGALIEMAQDHGFDQSPLLGRALRPLSPALFGAIGAKGLL